MLDGMMAMKASKGARAAIQGEDHDQAQGGGRAEASKIKAARTLLGPRGGLPSLKQDLLRLATLLRVEVSSGDTVDKLKNKLRPMIETLKGVPLEKAEPAATSSMAAASSALPEPARDPPRARPSATGTSSTPSTGRSSCTSSERRGNGSPATAAASRTAGGSHADAQRPGQPHGGPPGSDHATCDGDGPEPWNTPWGRRPLSGQQHELSAGRPRPRPLIAPLRQKLKAGQQLAICAAYKKHQRDHTLLKASAQTIHQAFALTVAQDYDLALSDPFVGLAGSWPYKARPSVCDGVARTASQMGHAVYFDVGGSRPYFLLVRVPGPSRLAHFMTPRARRDAANKDGELAANAYKAAAAQRRAGRHFLLELAPGVDPTATAEGQELLHEVGVKTFLFGGRTFVTSSSALTRISAAGQRGFFSGHGQGHAGPVRVRP